MDTAVLIERFAAVYGHTDFRRPELTEDEYVYKAERGQQMRGWLNAEDLHQLNAQNNWAEVCERVIKSFYMAHGQLARWDEYYWVKELEGAEQSQFALAFETFLYGEAPFLQRFETFVAEATQVYLRFRERDPAHQKKYNSKKLSWPFVSYFHFMLWPDREYVFVKPTPLSKAARLVNFNLEYQAAPNARTYARVQEFYRALWSTVQSLGGRDWMDVQTFIYVAGGEEPQPPPVSESQLAAPFSNIFADVEEALWAFDFLRDALGRLGISDPEDERFALTLRHNNKTLRLNYGMWAVLQFYGMGTALERVGIAFLEELVNFDASIPRWEPFSDERPVRVYELPIALARDLPAELQTAYETTFAYLAERFGNWSACPFRRFNQPEIAAAVFAPDKRVGLLATGIQPGQIKLADDEEVAQPMNAYFTTRTFDLLQALHATPRSAFYLEHKEDFKTYLEEPFQRLMRDVAARLPAAITARMETERNVFARILKNDYGQGGAWEHYWGAFYPQGGKRIADPQLFMGIKYGWLEFGFYIGEYGNASQRRILQNAQVHYEALVKLLEPQLNDSGLIYGSREAIIVAEDGTVTAPTGMTGAEWLRNPERGDFRVAVVLPRAKVLQYTTEELVAEVVATYERLFPLILLAVEDDPLPAILDYLDWPVTPPPQPDYPLAACAKETGFSEAELARWVGAIERKGQAILYGPPGTGKTYVAEHLARHLIGGGNGFMELVQFHPAYAYEDFIQGMRPQARDGGGLDYPLVPGRFLEFCAQAAQRQGRCVLIIDEINRANLARVFGELMYLLEYRDSDIPLAGGKRFSIPKNVRIIGTMNTADRSIALVDHALRRRFAFLKLSPNYEVLRRYHQQKNTNFPVEALIGKLQELNKYIGDFNYQVGITFFLREDLAETLPDIWQMEIEPYLEEYFFDQPGQPGNVDKFCWANVNQNGQLLP